MDVSTLGPAQQADTVDILCDAFADYPVMRYVLGPEATRPAALRTLMSFFVMARMMRGEPVLGVRAESGGPWVGVALVTLPGGRPSPSCLAAHREAVWAELGTAARERYEAYGAAASRFAVPQAHHHLNLIGVRRSHTGRGLARTLLEAVHELADRDPESTGVSLNTESPSNVALYEHFGYRTLGCAPVTADLNTWSLFRPGASRAAYRAQD